MGNRIVIDPTRIYAWISTDNKWGSASDSSSVCIPVTVGHSYTLQWSDTNSDNVGTIYRYGFSNSDTPSSQTLTQCVRTTPQDASSVTLTADRPYLVIQLSGSKFPDNLTYLVVEEVVLEEVVRDADFFLRHRAMMGAGGPEPDIPVTVTWSGSGADKTSSKIDATERDLYMTVPFVEGDSRLQSTATANSIAFRNRCAALYNDSALSEFVGYYNSSTGKIVSSRPKTSFCPTYKFDTEVKIVPRGYYAKLTICRTGDTFSSNDKFIGYVKAREVLVLRK